jgi:acyl-CoA thioesterase I
MPIRACACLALISLAGCGSSASPTAPDTSRHRIVVLGDSLAVSPSTSQNFATELQSRLNASHPGWTVTNRGLFGDTTTGGVGRIDQVLTADTGILVLELGANDGILGITVGLIEANLATMIERAQARGIRVLLCGMETFPFNGVEYALAFHGIFPRLAGRYQVPLVPFLLEGVALVPDLNGPDGVHPNAAGARVVAANVWPYLEALVSR